MERELAFWKKAGPQLPKGWWSGGGLPWAEVERLRDRYSVTLEAVQGIGETRHAGGREAVTALRRFWKSLPQLCEIEQLAEECDRVLSALDK